MTQEYTPQPIPGTDSRANNKAINIGVSSCLLGHQVRYDGKHKYHASVADQLCSTFRCLPICPEVAIGLGIPREPINLVQSQSLIRALGVNDPQRDVTTPLQAYAEFVAHQLPTICGYIFKSQSPSCALGSAPLTTTEGQVSGTVSGIYAQKLVTLFPDLPVIEETALTDKKAIDQFIEAVKHYAARTRNR